MIMIPLVFVLGVMGYELLMLLFSLGFFLLFPIVLIAMILYIIGKNEAAKRALKVCAMVLAVLFVLFVLAVMSLSV